MNHGGDGKAIVNIDYDHYHGAETPHAHDWDWMHIRPARLPNLALDRQRDEEKLMSGKIVSYQGYVAGWLNSSMDDFLGVLAPNAASTKYVLIYPSRQQSGRGFVTRQKARKLKSLVKESQIVRRGLLLPTQILLETDSRNQVFFGFDEVWFFPNKSVGQKPDSERSSVRRG